MGTKNNPGAFDCYDKAKPDEPMFVLLARDKDAPYLVRQWAGANAIKEDADPDKIAEALRCARAMEKWYEANVVIPQYRDEDEAVRAQLKEALTAGDVVATVQKKFEQDVAEVIQKKAECTALGCRPGNPCIRCQPF